MQEDRAIATVGPAEFVSARSSAWGGHNCVEGRKLEMMSLFRKRILMLTTLSAFAAGASVVAFTPWWASRNGTVELRTAAPVETDQGDVQDEDLLAAGIESAANPNLDPADVVKLQIESIQKSGADPEQLKVCYGLAAASNRAVTGPFDRFAQMLMQPPYTYLVGCERWQVGDAIIEGSFACVLVSALGNDGAPYAYRFFLEKQSAEPFRDCWMTVGVQGSSLKIAESQEDAEAGTD